MYCVQQTQALREEKTTPNTKMQKGEIGRQLCSKETNLTLVYYNYMWSKTSSFKHEIFLYIIIYRNWRI